MVLLMKENHQASGIVSCPECRTFEWASGRGAVAWFCVIVTFPLGLLLLLVFPVKHTCAKCGYQYVGGNAPARAVNDKPGHVTNAIVGMIIAAVIAFLAWAVWAFVLS